MLWKVLQKVVHKTAEATGEMIGNKIAEKILKPVPEANSRNVEEIVVWPYKRQVLNDIRQIL